MLELRSVVTTQHLHNVECALLPVLFYNASATTQLYTLSLHDALPIYSRATGSRGEGGRRGRGGSHPCSRPRCRRAREPRSEEHTSELQSHSELGCRLLLEKKKKKRPRRGQRNNTEDMVGRGGKPK